MFSKAELLDQTKQGLYKSWLMAFDTNDTPYVSMKPEYLTTVILGQHLSAWLRSQYAKKNYLVRFEERTKDVATRAFPVMPLPYRPKNVHGRAKKKTGEEGSVDLVVYRQESYFPETIAVFEVKNFDTSNELLCKDLDRNIEFMELTDPKKSNQIQFGVLTFFLLDTKSGSKEAAGEFIREKTEHFSQLLAPYNRPGITATLTLETLVNAPLLSHAEALREDEDGRPAIDGEEKHHIVYGACTLERV